MAGPIRIAVLADSGKARASITQFGVTVRDTVDKASGDFAGLKDKLKLGGLAAGAAGAKALVDALDVEGANQKLSAQLGLTGPAAAKFGKAAGDLYKNAYGTSVEETGQVIKSAFENGLVSVNASEKAIAKVGAQVLDYATLTGEDATAATRAVAQMIKTGLAKNATEAFDLLTRGQQLGINKSEDLLDTFNEYGTQFRKLGLQGPQALGLLRQGLQGGARDSDIVADSLKEFSIRAIDGSKTTADAFKAVGLNADQMAKLIAKGGPSANKALDLTLDRLRAIKDPAARSAAAVGLFGTQAEDLGDALFKLDPSSAAKGITGLAGASERAGKTLNDTAKSRLVTFGRSLQMYVVTLIGSKVIPQITALGDTLNAQLGPALSIIGAVLAKVGGFLSDHVGIIAAVVAGFVAYRAIMTTVGAVLTAYRGIVSVITTVTKIWTAVQAAFAVVMNLSILPILLAVVAIAAIAAVIVLAYKRSEKFRTVVDGAFRGIKTAVSGVVKFFTELVPSIAKAVGDTAKTLVTKGKNLIIGLAKGFLSVVGSVSRFFGGLASRIAKWVGDTAKTLVAKGKGLIVGLAKGYLAVITAPARFFAALGSTIGRWVGDTTRTLVSKGKNLIFGLINGYAAVISTVSSFFGGLGSKIFTWIGNTALTLVGKGKNLIHGLINGINEVVGDLLRGIGDLPGRIVRGFGNIGSLLYGTGKAILQGLIDGIQSKVSALTSKLSGITKLIPDFKGPLSKDRRLLTPAGKAIIAGLIRGMDAELPGLRRFLTGTTGLIEGGLSPTLSPALGAVTGPLGVAGGSSGGQVVINVYALQDGPEVGRRVADVLKSYVRTNGPLPWIAP